MSDIPYTPFRQRRRWYEDPRPLTYVVVEVKADGGDVNRNSIRAMAAVALDADGGRIARWRAALQALDGRNADARQMGVYRAHPEAWRANTADAQAPRLAIPDWTAWVRSLPGLPVFATHHLAQSSLWLDSYLRRFSPYGLVRGPYVGEPLFAGGGLDLVSLVMGVTGRSYQDAQIHRIPAEWRGHRDETHAADADAEMYADVLSAMLTIRRSRNQMAG